MTSSYCISKAAGDIKFGDKLCGWSFRKDEPREVAARVLDIKRKKDQLMIITADWSILVYPEHLLAVEVMA